MTLSKKFVAENPRSSLFASLDNNDDDDDECDAYEARKKFQGVVRWKGNGRPLKIVHSHFSRNDQVTFKNFFKAALVKAGMHEIVFIINRVSLGKWKNPQEGARVMSLVFSSSPPPSQYDQLLWETMDAADLYLANGDGGWCARHLSQQLARAQKSVELDCSRLEVAYHVLAERRRIVGNISQDCKDGYVNLAIGAWDKYCESRLEVGPFDNIGNSFFEKYDDMKPSENGSSHPCEVRDGGLFDWEFSLVCFYSAGGKYKHTHGKPAALRAFGKSKGACKSRQDNLSFFFK
jgi:hypothetical protein